MQGRNQIKFCLTAAALLIAVLTAGCLLLPRGFARTAISDLVSAALMLIAVVIFAIQAKHSQRRLRWFWMLQSAGFALWASDQFVWIWYDLVLHQKMQPMHPADALLFLAGAPMMAGFLLRPDREPSASSARLGVLDFFLLLLWWLYLYVSLVVSWQFVSPNLEAYNRNFDRLAIVENALIVAVIAIFWLKTSGKWKLFYATFGFAFIFNAIWFYVLNRALEQEIYFTGSWYDLPYAASFAIFAGAAWFGPGLTPEPESDRYSSWMTSGAMLGVLSLPILAIFALLDSRLPESVSRFRVVITLTTMFLMALLLFIKHRRLNLELQRANLVLKEASLTDPLTGLRNRRFFSATIEADVEQTFRSHSDQRNPRTSDLVFYLIDADNFKVVNDDYGHDVGDKVLIEMARRISSSIRHSDVLVRWGGEEFLIVSRYTDRKEAELLAERVLLAVGDKPFTLRTPGESIHRTCSIGWASFPWDPANPRAVSYEEVLTLADRGLQRAKQMGRNRAVGMVPASGKVPSTTIPGLHPSTLQVDLRSTNGPSVPV